ncbi:hypothetical protein FDO65_20810 [Nakamurella flava]|jgi:hypothetical protein|uniref:Uncharacterized protein n=1 Tax=Nakamurella flava TaxID=2576308 RepID=A0A4U6Q938_9ACTN|nr:hypothetical protein [Nakamurella flava]TKV56400.1 hypothetical protein FDO65_20810 [Nakamurella flava]
MVHPLDDTDYDVLNVVALKKMASAEVVAHDARIDIGTAERALAALADQGLLVLAGGMALPSDAAEPALRSTADTRYARLRTDDEIARLVDRFEPINTQFLTTMSAWQQVEVGGRKVTNDHSDPEYDGKIIDRVDRLVTRLQPLLDALAGFDPRFAGYPERFAAALAQIDAGRVEFVSSPTLDSAHTVWFEFHEDLLRTLGRERAE